MMFVAGPRQRSLRNRLHRTIPRLRVVLRNPHKQKRRNQPDHAATQQPQRLHHRPIQHRVYRTGKPKQRQPRRHIKPAVQSMHRVFVFSRAHHKDAHDTRNQIDRQHNQRKQNPLHTEHRIQRRTQNHRAHIFRRGRFEDVRATSRAVAHVVSHQVGDHSRVPRIVLRNPGLDLAHQVRAHIRGLRIDSAAQLRKQRHQRSAKPEPDQLVRHLLRMLQPAKEQEQRTHAQQRQRHHHQPVTAPPAQRHLQRLVQTRARRRSRPDVRPDRAVHPRIPSQRRAHRTHQKTDHRLRRIRRRPVRHVVSSKQHHRQHHRNRSNRLVLPPQKRLGPFANRIGDRLHLRRPRIRCNHCPRQHQRSHQRQHPDRKRNPQVQPVHHFHPRTQLKQESEPERPQPKGLLHTCKSLLRTRISNKHHKGGIRACAI